MITYKGYMEGPRWAGIKSAIRVSALNSGCDVKSLSEDKGLIRTCVFYTIEGDRSSIDRFKNWVKSIYNEYG